MEKYMVLRLLGEYVTRRISGRGEGVRGGKSYEKKSPIPVSSSHRGMHLLMVYTLILVLTNYDDLMNKHCY